MASVPSSKQYDLVLLGATGYTGKYTAGYISSFLPTDLKWALAGRSRSKLESLAQELKEKNPDRAQPGIEITALTEEDLTPLVRKTRLLINTVGPYHLYSSPVIAACAHNGTHYLDVTGEAPWVVDMIAKCDVVAKRNRAIIIPCIGFESSPSDLTTLAAIDALHFALGPDVKTKSVITGLTEFNLSASGGTLATALSIGDSYTAEQQRAAHTGTFITSPVPRPSSTRQSLPLFTRLTGVRRNVPHIGTLTTSVMAAPNIATVQRTWGLLDRGRYYGPRFEYYEQLKVSNALVGAALHYAIVIGTLLFTLVPPLRWLIARFFVTQPGLGPSAEAARRDSFEMKALATTDEVRPPRQALARMRYAGSVYYLTGLFLGEAAATLLRQPGKIQELQDRFDGGGLLTPATLGEDFIVRIVKAGVTLETEMIPE